MLSAPNMTCPPLRLRKAQMVSYTERDKLSLESLNSICVPSRWDNNSLSFSGVILLISIEKIQNNSIPILLPKYDTFSLLESPFNDGGSSYRNRTAYLDRQKFSSWHYFFFIFVNDLSSMPSITTSSFDVTFITTKVLELKTCVMPYVSKRLDFSLSR